MRRRDLLAASAPLLAAGCTLSTFDALAPRDRGARRVAVNARYGEEARQTLDVYAPADLAAPAPVLVFFYGGSWRNGDKNDYEFLGHALAAQGFVTVMPNYRLVPTVRFPDFLEDCAAAVAWTASNVAALGGDPNRMVFAGHSAGAYNAVMIVLNGAYLDAAGVDRSAVRGAVGLAGPYDFYPFDVSATQDAFGAFPDPQATQPVHFARADAPPLLLLWGEDDDTVGPRNIEGLERAMREVGGAVETRRYPGVDHIDILLALSRPFRERAPVLADVTAFAQRVAG
jgi:acetyl esterase/lipase